MTQLAGMAVKAVPWAFFVGCVSTGTSSLVSNTSLVTKIYFPREVLPLSTVLAQTFDSLIGGTLIACVLPFFGVRLSVELLWVPVLLALLWMFALAAALFLSRANLFFRDVKYMVQVFLTTPFSQDPRHVRRLEMVSTYEADGTLPPLGT